MSKSSTEAAQVWDPQQGYLDDLYSQGSDLLNTQSPTNAMTTQGREQALNYAGSPALSNLISTTQGGYNQFMNPQQNPYLDKAMQSAIRPVTQNYQENVLGGITDQAVQAGQTGGSRQGIAEGIAGRGYLDTIGDITNNMSMADYSQGQSNKLSAMGMGGDIANLGMMPSDIMTSIGQANQQDPWNQLLQQGGLIGGPTVLGGASEGGTDSALGWL